MSLSLSGDILQQTRVADLKEENNERKYVDVLCIVKCRVISPSPLIINILNKGVLEEFAEISIMLIVKVNSLFLFVLTHHQS